MGVFLAFADDLGAMLQDLKRYLSDVIKCLAVLRLAAALRAHPKKTQLTPIGPGSLEEVQTWVGTLHPPWNGMQVSGFLLYLGVMVGPSGHGNQWSAAASKFQVAASVLASLGMTWPTGSLWYGVAVQSILSYIGRWLLSLRVLCNWSDLRFPEF